MSEIINLDDYVAIDPNDPPEVNDLKHRLARAVATIERLRVVRIPLWCETDDFAAETARQFIEINPRHTFKRVGH